MVNQMESEAEVYSLVLTVLDDTPVAKMAVSYWQRQGNILQMEVYGNTFADTSLTQGKLYKYAMSLGDIVVLDGMAVFNDCISTTARATSIVDGQETRVFIKNTLVFTMAQ